MHVPDGFLDAPTSVGTAAVAAIGVGLALRGAGDWSDTRILLASGAEQERVLGEPGPWCDLSSADAGRTSPNTSR